MALKLQWASLVAAVGTFRHLPRDLTKTKGLRENEVLLTGTLPVEPDCPQLPDLFGCTAPYPRRHFGDCGHSVSTFNRSRIIVVVER